MKIPFINVHTISYQFLFRFDGEFTQSAGSSKYSHYGTLGMGNYMGKALTTGCRDGSNCLIKTELMDMSTLTWSDGPDYPFASLVIIVHYKINHTSISSLFKGKSKNTLLLPQVMQCTSSAEKDLHLTILSQNLETINGGN